MGWGSTAVCKNCKNYPIWSLMAFVTYFMALALEQVAMAQLLIGMEILMISSGLVLQEREQTGRKKFKRLKLFRKGGEKEIKGKKEKKGKNENVEKRRGSSLRPVLGEYEVLKNGVYIPPRPFLERKRETTSKRRGSILRPVLDEYKVLAKARPKKSKFVQIKTQTCDHDGKCEGPKRLTQSDPIYLYPISNETLLILNFIEVDSIRSQRRVPSSLLSTRQQQEIKLQKA